MQLAETKQEAGRCQDLLKQNEQFKIKQRKLEADLKLFEAKLDIDIEERNIPGQRIQNKEQAEKQLTELYSKSRSDFEQKLEIDISKPHLVSQQIHVKLDNVIEDRKRLELQLSETKQQLQIIEKMHEEQEKLKSTHAKLQDDMEMMDIKLGRAMEEKQILEGKLKETGTKSESDLKQVQDKLDIAIQERDTLESQLEMTKKEVKRVQDIHKKEKESLKIAKSKSELDLQEIHDKLNLVIEREEKTGIQFAEANQEVAIVPDLQRENQRNKIAHDKLEAYVRQMQDEIVSIIEEKICSNGDLK
ncbi:myosin-6-like [Ptychodera flava]|uniref:myosin-6-like n=1 Tax=Ptychodera flava TaxID=63121 RepID=UPI00396AA3F9